MTIVWGWNDRRRAMGLYAEYCPLQRGIRLFRLIEVRRVFWVMLVPLASMRVGYELRDLETGVLHWLSKDAAPRDAAAHPGDAESLAAQVNPGALQRRDAAMERDAEAMDTYAPFETRVGALLERLTAAEHWLRRATERSGAESLIAIQVFGFIVAAFAAAVAWSAPYSWLWLALVCAVLFLLGSVWSILRQLSHTGRNVVLEVMRRSAAPLRPTPVEATEALFLARRSGLRIAQALRPADLLFNTDGVSPPQAGDDWPAA